jgi:hypothetical protein
MRKRDRDDSASQDGANQAAKPRKRRRRNRALVTAAISVLVEASVLKRRGYGFAGNVVVRCREGHLFTTIWIPGASVKSLRLGPWRVQRCPIGQHWSVVTPVTVSRLTEAQRSEAREHKDIRLP